MTGVRVPDWAQALRDYPADSGRHDSWKDSTKTQLRNRLWEKELTEFY